MNELYFTKEKALKGNEKNVNAVKNCPQVGTLSLKENETQVEMREGVLRLGYSQWNLFLN